jgi:hypothetical protein
MSFYTSSENHKHRSGNSSSSQNLKRQSSQMSTKGASATLRSKIFYFFTLLVCTFLVKLVLIHHSTTFEGFSLVRTICFFILLHKTRPCLGGIIQICRPQHQYGLKSSTRSPQIRLHLRHCTSLISKKIDLQFRMTSMHPAGEHFLNQQSWRYLNSRSESDLAFPRKCIHLQYKNLYQRSVPQAFMSTKR